MPRSATWHAARERLAHFLMVHGWHIIVRMRTAVVLDSDPGPQDAGIGVQMQGQAAEIATLRQEIARLRGLETTEATQSLAQQARSVCDEAVASTVDAGGKTVLDQGDGFKEVAKGVNKSVCAAVAVMRVLTD